MTQPLSTGALAPGSTVGILGSGQLGRMLAMAAAKLGLKTAIYCEASGPARDVAGRMTTGRFDDLAALSAFAETVDVVTYEFENVPVAAAQHLAAIRPVRPGPQALAVAQDRLTEKDFISGLGIAVAPFAAVAGAADLAGAIGAVGLPAILKTRRLGYDGKGQQPIASMDEVASVQALADQQPTILEARVPFALELSVLVVRGVAGETAFYDIPQNTHAGGILRRSAVPAPIPAEVHAAACAMAGEIARALDYVGVLAVEMFLLPPDAGRDVRQRLVVNEIAPRVHNSGHWTLDACPVSQFENHIRAVCGWPLGSTARHSDAVMDNLIGGDVAEWPALAADPGASVHLYGKNEARPGRKMGHITRLAPKTVKD